jgi:hypothetical protein
MRIQTYQGFEVSEALRAGRTHFADASFIDPDWSRAYAWMHARLARHVGYPLEHPPVWGWTAPRQLATDVCRGTSKDCAKGWCTHLAWSDVDLLELEVPDELVLTSCESAWTAYGLNHWHLAPPEDLRALDEALESGEDALTPWEARLRAHLEAAGEEFTPGVYPPEFDAEVQASWERLLVPHDWSGERYLGVYYGPRGPWVQGVFPHLDPAWMLRSRRITGPARAVTVGPWEKWPRVPGGTTTGTVTP